MLELTKDTTAEEVAKAIQENAERFDGAPGGTVAQEDLLFERFKSEAHRLWAFAFNRGPGFEARVSALVLPAGSGSVLYRGGMLVR